LPVEPPTKPPAVDPRPLVPEPLELLDAFLLELLEAELAALRSEKRFVEPRLAPKLEAVWTGAPEAELSDEDEVFALFEELTVIVEALWELESAEPLPDEPEEEPPPNTLDAADMEPRVDPRLPLMLPRLPRNCGAMIAEKRSAVITPVTRSVRCRSPAAITAVRTTVPPGPPPPSFGARRSRFR